MQERDVLASSHGAVGQLHKIGIDFDTEHCAGLLRQARGQATGTAANFQHDILLRQLGRSKDDLQQIEVDQEILTKFILGMNAAQLE